MFEMSAPHHLCWVSERLAMSVGVSRRYKGWAALQAQCPWGTRRRSIIAPNISVDSEKSEITLRPWLRLTSGVLLAVFIICPATNHIPINSRPPKTSQLERGKEPSRLLIYRCGLSRPGLTEKAGRCGKVCVALAAMCKGSGGVGVRGAALSRVSFISTNSPLTVLLIHLPGLQDSLSPVLNPEFIWEATRELTQSKNKTKHKRLLTFSAIGCGYLIRIPGTQGSVQVLMFF